MRDVSGHRGKCRTEYCFALADSQRSILDSWRSDIQPPSMPGTSHPVDDPTRPGLEPDLRRFEAEGDPPL
jgi:hypothetical protein